MILLRALRFVMFLTVALLVLAPGASWAGTLPPSELNALGNWDNWVGSSFAGCADTSAGTVSGLSTTLPQDAMDRITALKSVYVQAAQQTNVPWQLLAAIQYRETNNSPSGSNLFQITGYSGPSDVLSQAVAAGNFLQHLVASNLLNHRQPLQQAGTDPEEIKDTLYSYNGRAGAYAQQAQQLGFDPTTQPYEGSPYVMNNNDAAHHNMGIITGASGPNTIDGTDTRFGAFAVYAFLGGGTASSDCSAGAVIGNEVQTAINYAWPDFHNAPYIVMKAPYAAAIQKAETNGEYVGGLSGEAGIDCGGFVTRVMRDSVADPSYNWGPGDSRQGNTVAQQAYMDAHPEKYKKLGQLTDTKQLQPGDIAINSEHTFIYVGNQAGFNGNSASASIGPESARSPMADNAYFSNSAGPFTWYRLINGSSSTPAGQ